MEFETQDIQVPTVYGSLGSVCKTQQIVEDHNSFFRAVSQVISGSQKGKTVVKYMENHSEEHMQFVGKDYVSMSDYIKSKMNYVGNRVTEIEIQATSNAFELDIFTNTGGK